MFASCLLYTSDIVKKSFLQSEMQEIVKRDLMNNNPDKLFQEYKEYFETKNLPIKIIRPDECFYRGRIGNEMIYGEMCIRDRSYTKVN